MSRSALSILIKWESSSERLYGIGPVASGPVRLNADDAYGGAVQRYFGLTTETLFTLEEMVSFYISSSTTL